MCRKAESFISVPPFKMSYFQKLDNSIIFLKRSKTENFQNKNFFNFVEFPTFPKTYNTSYVRLLTMSCFRKLNNYLKIQESWKISRT